MVPRGVSIKLEWRRDRYAFASRLFLRQQLVLLCRLVRALGPREAGWRDEECFQHQNDSDPIAPEAAARNSLIKFQLLLKLCLCPHERPEIACVNHQKLHILNLHSRFALSLAVEMAASGFAKNKSDALMCLIGKVCSRRGYVFIRSLHARSLALVACRCQARTHPHKGCNSKVGSMPPCGRRLLLGIG